MKYSAQPSLTYSLNRLKNYFSYNKYLKTKLLDIGVSRKEFDLNSMKFHGYPQNQNFTISKNELIPGWKLFERLELIKKCYPDRITSLLDISSCRGFYVLDACSREELEYALGIDVVESFIDESNAVKTILHEDKAHFEISTLEEIHNKIGADFNPFQITLCTGSYHYFYWGSAANPTAYMDHDKILGMLADITSQRLIFSGRLEFKHLEDIPKKIASSHEQRKLYTTEEFIKCANTYFNVSLKGNLGKSQLFVMDKK